LSLSLRTGTSHGPRRQAPSRSHRLPRFPLPCCQTAHRPPQGPVSCPHTPTTSARSGCGQTS